MNTFASKNLWRMPEHPFILFNDSAKDAGFHHELQGGMGGLSGAVGLGGAAHAQVGGAEDVDMLERSLLAMQAAGGGAAPPLPVAHDRFGSNTLNVGE